MDLQGDKLKNEIEFIEIKKRALRPAFLFIVLKFSRVSHRIHLNEA